MERWRAVGSPPDNITTLEAKTGYCCPILYIAEQRIADFNQKWLEGSNLINMEMGWWFAWGYGWGGGVNHKTASTATLDDSTSVCAFDTLFREWQLGLGLVSGGKGSLPFDLFVLTPPPPPLP